MSIKFDSKNNAHWFREPGEIGCRIGYDTLTKSLKTEMSLDPRNSVFVFHSADDGTVGTYEPKDEESSGGFFDWLKKIFSSAPEQKKCNLFVLKRGLITFEAPQIDNLTSKDFMELRCDCTFSAEIIDPEAFIVNTMDQFVERGFANSVSSQLRQNRDTVITEDLNDQIRNLQGQNNNMYAQMAASRSGALSRVGDWLNMVIGRTVTDAQSQNREIQRLIDANDSKIRNLRRQIEEINRHAETTYERDQRACMAMNLDYYCYTKNDLYNAFLQNLVSGILQRSVAEYTADEITKGFDFITLVQDVLDNNVNIVTRLRQYGLRVRIDDIRFVDESNARIIEEVRKSAEELRRKNWLMEQRIQEISYNREMQKLDVEEHELALEKQEAEFSFAEDSYRARVEHSVNQKMIDTEKEKRLNAIEELLKRDALKEAQETEFFTLELKRQGLLKQEEFSKFQAEIDTAVRDRELLAAEQQMRHAAYVNVLTRALELDELQAAKRVEDFKRAEALNVLRDQYAMQDLALDHNLETQKKKDQYADNRWSVEFNKTAQTDDYLRNKKVQDAAADIEIKRNEIELEQNTADREQARTEQANDAAFRRNMEYLRTINEAKRDERADDRAARQDELQAQVEIKRMESDVEAAHLNSDDYRARVQAEAQAAAQQQTLNIILNREDDRIRREQEQVQQKYAHEENMAAINSDARVAKAVNQEKDNTISRMEHAKQNSSDRKNMVCDSCNRYFPENYALCPLCGEKLRKVEI